MKFLNFFFRSKRFCVKNFYFQITEIKKLLFLSVRKRNLQKNMEQEKKNFFPG